MVGSLFRISSQVSGVHILFRLGGVGSSIIINALVLSSFGGSQFRFLNFCISDGTNLIGVFKRGDSFAHTSVFTESFSIVGKLGPATRGSMSSAPKHFTVTILFGSLLILSVVSYTPLSVII